MHYNESMPYNFADKILWRWGVNNLNGVAQVNTVITDTRIACVARSSTDMISNNDSNANDNDDNNANANDNNNNNKNNNDKDNGSLYAKNKARELRIPWHLYHLYVLSEGPKMATKQIKHNVCWINLVCKSFVSHQTRGLRWGITGRHKSWQAYRNDVCLLMLRLPYRCAFDVRWCFIIQCEISTGPSVPVTAKQQINLRKNTVCHRLAGLQKRASLRKEGLMKSTWFYLNVILKNILGIIYIKCKQNQIYLHHHPFQCNCLAWIYWATANISTRMASLNIYRKYIAFATAEYK